MAEKIHARELRIGNIYKSTGFNHPRLGIIGDKVDGQDYAMITGHGIDLVERGEMDFDPMPISEGWCIRAEFKKDSDGEDMDYIEWYEKDLPIIGTLTLASTGDRLFADDHDLTIYYVHQLQNWWFMATGEELNFHPTSHLNQ